MPKEDGDWIHLIDQLVRHLEERYGEKEVRSWFFEVWNEPNLRFFFDGTMEDYFHLYEITARTIKGVDAKLRVGGPATSNNMWITEFRQFCDDNHVPYDFITTHHYPADDPLSRAGMNGAGVKGDGMDMTALAQMSEEERNAILQKMAEMFTHPNTNPRDVLAQTARKAKEEAGDYPLYYTEWNVGHYDVSYAAAGVTATLAYNEGLVEGYSYWCVSDIFEEMGLHGLPFNNEFGLVNVYGTPKPVYRLFQALHEAGTKRLSVEGEEAGRTAEVLALADKEEVMLFVYNHDIEERVIKTEEVEIRLSGKVAAVKRAAIDADTTAPYKAWKEMGKPTYPNQTQLLALEKASQLVYEELETDKGSPVLTVTAKPESVTIYKVVLA